MIEIAIPGDFGDARIKKEPSFLNFSPVHRKPVQLTRTALQIDQRHGSYIGQPGI